MSSWLQDFDESLSAIFVGSAEIPNSEPSLWMRNHRKDNFHPDCLSSLINTDRAHNQKFGVRST